MRQTDEEVGGSTLAFGVPFAIRIFHYSMHSCLGELPAPAARAVGSSVLT